MVTDGAHPYTANWWAPGHLVGYETTFVNAAYDFLTALSKGTEVTPNFKDGLALTKLMVAANKSSEKGL